MIDSTAFNIAKCTIFGVFGGCCSNMYTLELLVREKVESSSVLTFFQFIAVVFVGLLINGQIVTGSVMPYYMINKPKIPLKSWFISSIIFGILSMLNNLALMFHISLPLHIVLKSSSLPVSLFMNYIISKRKVTIQKFVSVMLVTIGIIAYTLNSVDMDKSESIDLNSPNLYLIQICGILIVSFSVLLVSILGEMQSKIYKKYGRHWKDGLLYSHLIGLISFLPLIKNIISFSVEASQSRSVRPSDVCSLVETSICKSILGNVFINRLHMPILWFYVLANCITQVMCVWGVVQLTSTVSPVTLNLILTLRKFVSLFISVLVFNNIFTYKHFISSLSVIVGTIMYSVCTSEPKKVKKS